MYKLLHFPLLTLPAVHWINFRQFEKELGNSSLLIGIEQFSLIDQSKTIRRIQNREIKNEIVLSAVIISIKR